MKASLAWLNEYLDPHCSADEADQFLSRVGFPVEGCEPVQLSTGVQDTVLDVEVTSNRSDCLSHLGLARELASTSGRSLRLPSFEPVLRTGQPASELATVQCSATSSCPLYTARLLTGVRVSPSPPWLIERLEAVGQRPVNNIVDATNFVLLETGQPLHAFDLARLSGRRIIVRLAQGGEHFVAIDQSKHKLADPMLVIADAEHPVAVAGVMGGLETEVSSTTQQILLESALFDPVSVRRTSRKLKLASESSYRFERGVDPVGVDAASRRAADLILQIAGGQLAEGVIRVGQDDPIPQQLTMRAERCRSLLGLDLSIGQMADYLHLLGIETIIADQSLTCHIPTYRRDLQREVDLIEEIARLHGLEQLEVRSKIQIVVRPVERTVLARQVLAQTLCAHGFHETITPSFVSRRHGKPFLAEGADPVLLDDESRQVGRPMLRPLLLPSLLHCRKANQDLGNSGIKLFESACCWQRHAGEMVESTQLQLLSDAEGSNVSAALRTLRGAVEELFDRLAGPGIDCRFDALPNGSISYLETTAAVQLGSERIGTMGLVSPAMLDLFELKTNVVTAQLNLNHLLRLYPPKRRVQELPRYPGIERDLSVIVDELVSWQTVEQTVLETRPQLLARLQFLGVYRGKPIPDGCKSISFRMIFRDPSATLRHDQVDPQVESVVQALQTAIDAELRQ